MNRTENNPWLHRFAVLTAAATLVLIGVGGLVTSHGAGMAVPDWPTSYGYNMFALPFKFWKGGAFFEHTHRLAASGVGLLTMVLMVWLWLKDSRRWLRWLGVAAFFAVVLQGVLGGLRVVLYKDAIGIFHAALAQGFFVLVCAIALFTSRWWKFEIQNSKFENVPRRLILFSTILIFCQLVLGATMRHQHAGLAISDFPKAHGQWWPDTSVAAVTSYNAQRVEIGGENPITAEQIYLQMAHRIMAFCILGAVGFCMTLSKGKMRQHARIWHGMILVQAALGAWTIWSNKAADVATAHVVVGALSLVTGALLTIIAFRFRKT